MRVRPILLLPAAAAIYGCSLLVNEALRPAGDTLPVVWLPIGVGFALVAVWGPRVAAAIVLCSLVDGALEGYGVWQTAVYAAGAAASVLVIRALVGRIGKLHGEHARDTVLRVAASAVGALVGATTMAVAVGWWWDVLHVFLAQLTGVLAVGPLARSWLRRGGRGAASAPETAAMLLATAAAAEAVSSGALGLGVPLSYLLFPPVVWAALRTGRLGVGAATFLTAVVAAGNSAAGRGPFAAAGDVTLRLDAFLLVLALTGLLLVGIENARRSSEASLRQSEERFRAMIENATDLVCVFAADGTIQYHSPSSERILGYDAAELVGRNVRDFIHPDDHVVVETHITGATRSAAGVSRVRFRHRDGRWLELEGHARDLTETPGVGGVIVNARDVTRRRAAERELAAAEQRYRQLVEGLPLAIYLRSTDPDAPTYVSPQIEQLLGYPVARWLTEPELDRELVHPDDREALERWLTAEDGASPAVFRIRASDGRYVWLLNQRSPIYGGNGEVVGRQGYVLDVTEQKVLEEQLRQSQRLESLGLLAGGVAHDFNNLLTAIAGYAGLARARVTDDPQVQQDLDEVLAAAGRAGDLTQQLLAFGRQQTMVAAVTNLNEVVTRTERMLGRVIDERIGIECRLDAGLHLVRADAGQIEQVLVNLALNARDAMPDGGTLTIETANVTVEDAHGDVEPGEYAVVTVADTGGGIDPDTRERLFEPFFTTKEVGKGTGLGLAVVFGIVEQSRGHIVVDSEPGVGSRFRVFLPRTDGVLSEPRPAPAPAAVTGSETVLLVEDEDIVRRLTTTMLETNGYTVITAATPDEALAIDAPYDVLVTDVVMPGLSGPELWQRLAERGRPTAVLFTSGYSATAVADVAALPGELLEKPFTADELARRVRATLDARATAAAA